ncbi:NUDIX hydrolase [Caulobacter hibisci]|uniref:NUDIX domain-containing protein n=1 Tax=Caulobacter hibisci TaxID=2035993 RepID=A0ABS0T0V2_9CAUL|nr:NUDIX domain-containing protein [Caulobacter hibisci]MBI1685512.1 NUDIX domain-containing protein [Caulobacter hibisci]
MSSWRPKQAVRVVAIGLLRDEGRLLVAEVCNDDGSVKGWRPLGGGVEFGETSEQTLRREFLEETGFAIEVAGPPKVLENLYEHEGHIGHEIMFVYEITTADPRAAERERFVINENSQDVWVEWVAVERFTAGERLLPDGLTL